jgi:hypothetical protein
MNHAICSKCAYDWPATSVEGWQPFRVAELRATPAPLCCWCGAATDGRTFAPWPAGLLSSSLDMRPGYRGPACEPHSDHAAAAIPLAPKFSTAVGYAPEGGMVCPGCDRQAPIIQLQRTEGAAVMWTAKLCRMCLVYALAEIHAAEYAYGLHDGVPPAALRARVEQIKRQLAGAAG